MANYAYMGKGIVTLELEGGAGGPVDIGNVSALSLNVNENIIKQKNYRTPGGGTYAQVNQIESVEVAMTLHDFSPENFAMVTFGTVTDASTTATIEALTSGAKTFKMVFAGVNEANTGKTVTVTAHRVKIGAAQNLGLIGDDFGALEVTGELLIDTSIVAPGESQYFKVVMDKAA